MSEDFNWGSAVVVFAAYFFVDFLYAFYTLCVVQKRALAASNSAAVMYFLLAIGVLSYTKNYLYLIPIVGGSWLGTFVLLKWKSD